MKSFYYDKVSLDSGYLANKQKLNETVTINAVYDRFYDTGRIGAFDFEWKDGDDKKPHIFWDSDVAKWMEGAIYIYAKTGDKSLLEKVESLIEKIKKYQSDDGYFNIFYTVCEPEKRFTNRDKHELYCAGHLLEAAVAYAEVTGKTDFLDCMEKYTDLIHRVFVVEKSAQFDTPGHEEIEYALIRAYRFTGKAKFLDLAKYFIDTRGSENDRVRAAYNQSHKPVREQDSAVGHSVRAVYLYTAMAALAKETGDESLFEACKKLYNDIMTKMYVTGGIGSTRHGEAFTVPYDLPNDTAYTETCAGIGLAMFANEMLSLENDAKYADTVERALYNGILSGISLDGKSFFYENPLEITLSARYNLPWKELRMPITQRVECFDCSCCPPNLNRFFGSLSRYFFALDSDTLYVNQFASSTLKDGNITCTVKTDYPISGKVELSADGVQKIAVRIPWWCENFTINCDYEIKNGYAVINETNAVINFDMTPFVLYSDPRVIRNEGKVCVMRGPVVYCAEGIDNGALHSLSLKTPLEITEKTDEYYGLVTLEAAGVKKQNFSGSIYSKIKPHTEKTIVKLIPYNSFANRGETDMAVWFDN